MRKAQLDAGANATAIRRLSLLSLAFLLLYAIVLVLGVVAVATAPPPGPCHAISCGPPPALGYGAVTGLCLIGPTLGGLLAGALAWLESVQQAVRNRRGFWLIGLLLTAIVALAPILAPVVLSATAHPAEGAPATLPFGITPTDPVWDLLSVPLLTIPVALVTLLFGRTLAPSKAHAAVAGTPPSDPGQS